MNENNGGPRMANLFDSEFISVSTTILQKIQGPLPFNVAVRRHENAYTVVFDKNEPIDLPRLQRYEDSKGLQSVFVHKDEYRQYLLYVEQVANKMFGHHHASDVNVEESVYVIKEMTNLTMLEIAVQNHVDQKSVSYAATTIKGCLDLLAGDPKSLFKIFKLLSAHPYLIKHAISTAIFALIIAKTEKLESEKTLITIGLGSILHDIGMSMLTFDTENQIDLNASERKEVKQHPQLGKQVLDTVKSVTPEIRSIVLQHHEQPNGQGYPNGLHDKQIYYLAKIVSIADCFSALISKRPYRDAFSPVHALAIMNEDRGKFDQKMLDQFSKIFIETKDRKAA